MLPVNAVLVRHGLSEKNFLNRKIEKGEATAREIEIVRTTPDHRFRLKSPEGVQQAVVAGRWLKKNLGFDITAAACSHHVRAVETAGWLGRELGLTLRWRRDPRIGERQWGSFDLLEAPDRDRQYDERLANALHWVPPGGESLRLLDLFIRSVFDTLHREFSDANMLLASHGELILGWQTAVEHWDEERIGLEIANGVPNGGIVHYTRQNPSDAKDVRPSYRWKRRMCPWDKRWKDGTWNGEWTEIVHRTFTSDDLVAEAERFPSLLA